VQKLELGPGGVGVEIERKQAAERTLSPGFDAHSGRTDARGKKGANS
jgi:hypothetical protein